MITIMNIILILAIIAFAIYQYRKYDGKPFRYFLGSISIFLGILFIEPTPDPLSFGVYCAFNSASCVGITASNISSILWSFEMWSIPLGIALIIAGMGLLKLKFKDVWKKMNIEKYWLAFFLAVLVVIIIAMMNIKGVILNSTVFLIFAILPIAYYFLYRKDKSEALALFLSEILIWLFGFAHLMYYVLQKQAIPETIMFLNNHPVMGNISSTLGYSNVNPVSLLVSVTIGFILAYAMAKLLKEKF